MNINTTTTLHNGVKMPLLGLGVFQAQEGNEVINAIHYALETGYRHIDTAAIYRNEEGVGKAIKDSKVDRNELFITTKVWNSEQGYETTLAAFDRSLNKLQMDYVDLYLVHWPVVSKFNETWRALEHLYSQGKVKAIGVSNFFVHHLEKLYETAKIRPMVNQVEFHPYLQQKELVNFCKANKIQYQAWSPMMKGAVLDIETLVDLGKKYNKSAIQITLRWALQKGIVIIPKSVKRERIVSNANLFDFELSDKEMETINRLDKNERIGPDPDNFNF